MNVSALLSLLFPIIVVLVVGGLVGLRMLKPYGNRILDLVEETRKSRQSMLEEERALQQIRDRLDVMEERLGTVAERQDFLESLVEARLEGGEGARELSGGGSAAGSEPDRSGTPRREGGEAG